MSEETGYCTSCRGEGVIHTGIDESPVIECSRCDGTGELPICRAPVAPLIPTEQQQPANEESEADYALIQRLGGLLAEIAIVMKGPEPARTRWSYADLPKLVEVMAVELDMYRTVYGTTFPEGWGVAPPAVTAKPDLAAPVGPDSKGGLDIEQVIDDLGIRAEVDAVTAANRIRRAAPVEQASAEQNQADVEKVARAMALHIGWEKWDSAANCCDTPDGSDPDDERDYWIGLARAALAAASIPPLQAPEPAPESVRDAALVRAAEYLEGYAKYCYEVKPDDIERHPYIPSIEEAAADLRAMLAVDQEKSQ